MKENEPESELIKEMIQKFGITQKTALAVVDWYNVRNQERMSKWYENIRKTQKNKADIIYSLFRRLKRGDNTVIDQIEKLILELCVGDY